MTTQKPKDPDFTPPRVEPLAFEQAFRPTDELTVGDFWRWGFSDLKLNIIRGVLAEFLVARAVGDPTDTVRDPWANFDVRTPDGVPIEVKSSAYLQGWPQEKLTSPQFSGLTGRSWAALTGYTQERETKADVFVFCLHCARTHDEYDPLDISQWIFWVVAASVVKATKQRSVGLGFCDVNSERLRWDQLAEAVQRAGSPKQK